MIGCHSVDVSALDETSLTRPDAHKSV